MLFKFPIRLFVLVSLVSVAQMESAEAAKTPPKRAVKLAPLAPAEPPLRNWGLDNSEFPSHIEAKRAWKITEGSNKVIVAVIDTGIDASQPDLKDNLWHKPGAEEFEIGRAHV